ncbi:hypothetical protein [Streptomyces sp. NPDC001292]|uniref:hypothetical protein n=1 Tax=Streptomyces sp. NPDC001292 TaxID=3364558 RepID=UPI0036CF7DFD
MSSPVRAWAAPVIVNLVLGIVAVIPLWFLMMFLRNHPLAELGLTGRDPTDNDGVLPWMLLLVPMWAAFLGLWLPVNSLMRRKREVTRRRYWTFGSLVVLSPMATLLFLIAVL